MPDISKDSITSLRLSLRVEGEPHFLIMLGADGHVKRMGYSALSVYEESVATGRVDGGLQQVLASMPEALLGRGGVYEDPGTEGSRCQWRVEFDGASGPIRLDISYYTRSAGLPPAIAQVVQKAEAITESLYREHLDSAEAAPISADSIPERAPTFLATETTEPQAGYPARSGDIAEYLSFKGRIGRVDYLLKYVLPISALSFAGGFADGLVGFGGANQLGPMSVIAMLITIWPGFAGWAKRMHDFDTSLWIVPGVLFGGGIAAGVTMALNTALGVGVMVLWVLAIVLLALASYLWPGTKGPNRYGPDPHALRPVS